MVIVITGPIASGKSTIAREAARELERRGTTAAVIDLDLVYEMLAGDHPKSDNDTWRLARRCAAVLARTFIAEGVAVVIAEGSFNDPTQRAPFAELANGDPAARFVMLLVGYDEALRRAASDPTRGVSRNPAFLGPYFETFTARLAGIPATDLVIDTEQSSIAASAIAVADLAPWPAVD